MGSLVPRAVLPLQLHGVQRPPRGIRWAVALALLPAYLMTALSTVRMMKCAISRLTLPMMMFMMMHLWAPIAAAARCAPILGPAAFTVVPGSTGHGLPELLQQVAAAVPVITLLTSGSMVIMSSLIMSSLAVVSRGAVRGVLGLRREHHDQVVAVRGGVMEVMVMTLLVMVMLALFGKSSGMCAFVSVISVFAARLVLDNGLGAVTVWDALLWALLLRPECSDKLVPVARRSAAGHLALDTTSLLTQTVPMQPFMWIGVINNVWVPIPTRSVGFKGALSKLQGVSLRHRVTRRPDAWPFGPLPILLPSSFAMAIPNGIGLTMASARRDAWGRAVHKWFVATVLRNFL